MSKIRTKQTLFAVERHGSCGLICKKYRINTNNIDYRYKMKKKEYIVPETKVYPMEEELFLCTSVQPQVPGSTEEEWEEDEDVNSGEFDI